MIRMMHAMTDDGDDDDGNDDDDDGDDHDGHDDDDDHDVMVHEQLLGLGARFRTVCAGGAPRGRNFLSPCAVMGPHYDVSASSPSRFPTAVRTTRLVPYQWMAVGPSVLRDVPWTCTRTDKRKI